MTSINPGRTLRFDFEEQTEDTHVLECDIHEEGSLVYKIRYNYGDNSLNISGRYQDSSDWLFAVVHLEVPVRVFILDYMNEPKLARSYFAKVKEKPRRCDLILVHPEFLYLTGDRFDD